MIYCVVPRPLTDTLYEQMVERYADDENVTVIVDRRHADRRARRGSAAAAEPRMRKRRVVRDRRRARVVGDMLPLAHG